MGRAGRAGAPEPQIRSRAGREPGPPSFRTPSQLGDQGNGQDGLHLHPEQLCHQQTREVVGLCPGQGLEGGLLN